MVLTINRNFKLHIMKKIKLVQKALFIALFSLILVSCATVQTGVQQLELGMTKSQVIKRMGSDFQVVTMTQTNEGSLEVLRYTQYEPGAERIPTDYYFLHFLNGKLVEVNGDKAGMHRPNRPNRPHNPPRR